MNSYKHTSRNRPSQLTIDIRAAIWAQHKDLRVIYILTLLCRAGLAARADALNARVDAAMAGEVDPTEGSLFAQQRESEDFI